MSRGTEKVKEEEGKKEDASWVIKIKEGCKESKEDRTDEKTGGKREKEKNPRRRKRMEGGQEDDEE